MDQNDTQAQENVSYFTPTCCRWCANRSQQWDKLNNVALFTKHNGPSSRVPVRRVRRYARRGIETRETRKDANKTRTRRRPVLRRGRGHGGDVQETPKTFARPDAYPNTKAVNSRVPSTHIITLWWLDWTYTRIFGNRDARIWIGYTCASGKCVEVEYTYTHWASRRSRYAEQWDRLNNRGRKERFCSTTYGVKSLEHA